MNKRLKYFIMPFSLMFLVGCTEDILQGVGVQPDENTMDSETGQLHSEQTFTNRAFFDLYEGNELATDGIYYTLTKPATTNIAMKVVADEALVKDFNEANKTNHAPLPMDNVHFENDGSFAIPAGKQISETIEMSISTEGLEYGTTYLLPLTLENNVEKDVAEKRILYYGVYITEKITTCTPSVGVVEEIPPLLPNLTSVFYVNTEEYQPLIAKAWGIKRTDKVYRNKLYSLGNIVNLKVATVGYDVSNGQVSLKLGNDLSYVLEHGNKYIRPLQDYDRKVCLCIENGGQGVGFCNMTDAQIVDFVKQVKDVIEHYQLDGVNLWDEDDKYKDSGMPELNTTSYPKLIKALRTAMPGKLLTLVDKGNATEYFYDVQKCGGIKVGEWIDYAWHGYVSQDETMSIINPEVEEQKYSSYTRNPIAGLLPKMYGNINLPRYRKEDYRNYQREVSENIAKWKYDGLQKNDILVFGTDLIGNEYGDRETTPRMMLGFVGYFMADGYKWAETRPGRWGLSKGEASYAHGMLDYKVDYAGNNGYLKDW